LNRSLQAIWICAHNLPWRRDACVVDQRRDAFITAQSLFHVAQICRHREIGFENFGAHAIQGTELLRQVLQTGAIARDENHIVATSGKTVRVSSADA
jgi:hypothetical protein